MYDKDEPFKMKNSTIHDLEGKHMMAILLYLSVCPDEPVRKIDLYEEVSSNPRMPDKLDLLEMKYGLVKQNYDRATRTTYISLTKAGAEAARLISVLEELLDSNRRF